MSYTTPTTYTIRDNAGAVISNMYAQEISRSAFTSATQTDLLAPRRRDEDIGADEVRRFIGWRRIEGSKRKWPFELHAELCDGTTEWVPVWRSIGTISKRGVFKEAVSGKNLGVLRPADTYLQRVPTLKTAVFDTL